MFFDKSDYIKSDLNLNVSLSSYLSVPISTLTLVILFFILTPNEPIYLCNILSIISFTDNLHFDN